MWVIARYVAGIELRTPAMGSQPAAELGVIAIVGASLFASLAGLGLLVALERFIARPRAIWTTVAVVVFLLSLGGPLSGNGIGTANRVTLMLIHLSVAAALIPLLSRTATL